MNPPAPLGPLPRWRVVADTYEWDGRAWTLVVRHELYGGTKERALEVLAAHMQSDAFLRGCTEQGRFGAVQCFTDSYLEQLR